MKKTKPFILSLLPVLLFSCAAPSSVSPSGQVAIRPQSLGLVNTGKRQFQQLKAKTPRVSNSQVQRVANRLTKVIQLPRAEWEFVTFKNNTPNAFALPGGKVGIHTAILPITKNDAGLATVLAHEIAHVSSNHHAARQQRSQTIGIGSAILGGILGAQTGNNYTGQIQQGATLAFGLPFSRSQESDADRAGLIFMAKAGYDPREAIGFWQRFAAYNRSKGAATPAFLRTHPLDTQRIADLQAFLPIALAEYNKTR